MRQLVGHRTVTEGLQVRNSLKTLLAQVLFHSQDRSQYEQTRGTCLSHLRFDPSDLFKQSHHKQLGGDFNLEYCLSPYFFLATALTVA